uniref:Deubiquitination hydrolase n=1 Tax=Clandestinovirus TaxID=2831644 RepID=A0A8F8KQQ8_9VIRU|nr:deubiquitination hydrolase [Clandestinovirus]
MELQIDRETLLKFKSIVQTSGKYEVAGTVTLDKGGSKVEDIGVTKNGNASEVRLPKDCIECFHTHPKPPNQGLISVPSGTDLLVAYRSKMGTRQWLATNQGLWVYWRRDATINPMMEFFVANNDVHPVTLNRLIVDWCMEQSITFKKYIQFVQTQFNIDVLYFAFPQS